jgi:hypothetical protein
MLEIPAVLEEFRQALGEPLADLVVDTWGWTIEGGHGAVSCKPGSGFHISIFGYTDYGQERAIHAFAKFARLVEIDENGGRLFTMARLPDKNEAAILRRWLALRP